MKAQAKSKQGKPLQDFFKSGNLPRNASFTMAWNLIRNKDNLYISTPHLQQEILKATHNHPITGHLKLLDLVARDLSWSGMLPQIKALLEGCFTCARTKTSKNKPV